MYKWTSVTKTVQLLSGKLSELFTSLLCYCTRRISALTHPEDTEDSQASTNDKLRSPTTHCSPHAADEIPVMPRIWAGEHCNPHWQRKMCFPERHGASSQDDEKCSKPKEIRLCAIHGDENECWVGCGLPVISQMLQWAGKHDASTPWPMKWTALDSASEPFGAEDDEHLHLCAQKSIYKSLMKTKSIGRLRVLVKPVYSTHLLSSKQMHLQKLSASAI